MPRSDPDVVPPGRRSALTVAGRGMCGAEAASRRRPMRHGPGLGGNLRLVAGHVHAEDAPPRVVEGQGQTKSIRKLLSRAKRGAR